MNTGWSDLKILSYTTHWGFLHSSVGKESACSAGDPGSIPELGRSTEEGKGYPLQYSGLENSMDYSPWSHKKLDTAERISPSLSPSETPSIPF